MKINQNQKEQNEKLKALCLSNNISFETMSTLLDSVKTKKLLKRNNYHQQKINDLIEKEIK